MYKRTAWYFDKNYSTNGGSFEMLKEAAQKPEVLNELDIGEDTAEIIFSIDNAKEV